jgi:hypothetical protein
MLAAARRDHSGGHPGIEAMAGSKLNTVQARTRGNGKSWRLGFVALALVLAVLAVGLQLLPRSDDSVRQSITRQSIGTFLATGQMCPCPFSLDRLGRRCVAQSEYTKSSGTRPICFPDDVTDAMVQAWKASHR